MPLRFLLTSMLCLAISMFPSSKVHAADNKYDAIETAARAGSFNTLLRCLAVGGLIDDIASLNHGATIFAPTDEAFAALPEGTLDELLKPENRATLRTLLLLHVANSKISLAESKEPNSVKVDTYAKKKSALQGKKTGRRSTLKMPRF